MKKQISFLLALVLVLLTAAGCGRNRPTTADRIDDVLDMLEEDYSKYLDEETTVPRSVLDALNLMLADYVSGLSTPAPSAVPSTPVDPGDPDAADLISGATTLVSDEAELEALIFNAVKNAETQIGFEVQGGWLTQDLLYDIVFHRIHDVYMIDAFGLHSYTVSWTTTPTAEAYSLSFDFFDGHTSEEILEMRREIDAKSKEVVRDLQLGGKSDYEKIRAINDFLCATVYYPDKPYIMMDHNPYGTLFDGRAVCEGYARTAKILCALAGLDCYYVVGYCNNDPVNGGHGWNLVKVDGEWYQLDVTWNDGDGSDRYFLVTDDFMSLSRVWERGNYPESAKHAYGN